MSAVLCADYLPDTCYSVFCTPGHITSSVTTILVAASLLNTLPCCLAYRMPPWPLFRLMNYPHSIYCTVCRTIYYAPHLATCHTARGTSFSTVLPNMLDCLATVCCPVYINGSVSIIVRARLSITCLLSRSLLNRSLHYPRLL